MVSGLLLFLMANLMRVFTKTTKNMDMAFSHGVTLQLIGVTRVGGLTANKKDME